MHGTHTTKTYYTYTTNNLKPTNKTETYTQTKIKSKHGKSR